MKNGYPIDIMFSGGYEKFKENELDKKPKFWEKDENEGQMKGKDPYENYNPAQAFMEALTLGKEKYNEKYGEK